MWSKDSLERQDVQMRGGGGCGRGGGREGSLQTCICQVWRGDRVLGCLSKLESTSWLLKELGQPLSLPIVVAHAVKLHCSSDKGRCGRMICLGYKLKTYTLLSPLHAVEYGELFWTSEPFVRKHRPVLRPYYSD